MAKRQLDDTGRDTPLPLNGGYSERDPRIKKEMLKKCTLQGLEKKERKILIAEFASGLWVFFRA